MLHTFTHIKADRRGAIVSAHFRGGHLPEPEILHVFEELLACGTADGVRRLVLSFGPKPPEMMYSIFLAKLFMLQRLLHERGRDLVLCDVGPAVSAMLEAVAMDVHFHIVADFDAALALPLPGGPGERATEEHRGTRM